jgi:diguanylate cyclase (GGDEF)-like protein/PAS domain S-box-containing protein
MRSRGEARDAHPSPIPGTAAPLTVPARDYPELLQRVPAIIYIADTGTHGRWRYISPQVKAILGYGAEEWCERAELWLECLHPEDRDRVLASEADHAGRAPGAAAGDPAGGVGAVEYRMRHREGHVIWIRDDAVLVRDHDGVMRWHGVLSDVTDRKDAELELERRAAQQAAVAAFGEHALERASIEQLMQEAVTVAAQSLGVEMACVAQLLAEEDCFLLRADHGGPDGIVGELRFPAGTRSQAGFAVLSGRPAVVSDWSAETRFEQGQPHRERGVASGISVVIEGSRGPFGALGAFALEPRDYGDGDIDFLQSLANVLADAIERQTIEDDIRHRALHDPLTGLPNRVLFLDRLEQALARLGRRPSLAAVLFLDLDHFKLVNDSLGHHVGDELLTAAAPRLTQAVRGSDTVARFGGDEFGILLEDITGEHDAIEMAERIAATFARPFVLGGNEHFVTASVGIAVARGGELPSELIRDADAAMYRAKERGRARYELFDELMRARAISRLRVENDLRRAMERGELRLDYQPIVALNDRRVVSVEALLRWEHPERGEISPAEFIPIAEENGLFDPIGRWVLERACRQATRWCQQWPDAPPLGISVNLTSAQLVKPDLPALVESMLAATGLDPAALSLEVTETTTLRELDALIDVLGALKALGVRLVLDDFGTGHSSLAHLTRLPVDALKIARSFVDGLGTRPRDSAITEAIIAMARALSLDVVAEGVESEVQAEELLRLGCGYAQGFHCGPPMPANQVSSVVRAGGPTPQPARASGDQG